MSYDHTINQGWRQILPSDEVYSYVPDGSPADCRFNQSVSGQTLPSSDPAYQNEKNAAPFSQNEKHQMGACQGEFQTQHNAIPQSRRLWDMACILLLANATEVIIN